MRGVKAMTQDVWEQTVQVVNSLGLHARPAGKIWQTAQRYAAEMTLETGAGTVDAKSILDILTLAAPQGTWVRIRAQGPDAQDAVEAVAGLFAARFGEE